MKVIKLKNIKLEEVKPWIVGICKEVLHAAKPWIVEVVKEKVKEMIKESKKVKKGKKLASLVLAGFLAISLSTATFAGSRNRNIEKPRKPSEAIDIGKINLEDSPNEHIALSVGNRYLQVPKPSNSDQITPGASFNGAIWYDSTDDLLEACIGGAKVNLGATASVETLDAAYVAGNNIDIDVAGGD